MLHSECRAAAESKEENIRETKMETSGPKDRWKSEADQRQER